MMSPGLKRRSLRQPRLAKSREKDSGFKDYSSEEEDEEEENREQLQTPKVQPTTFKRSREDLSSEVDVSRSPDRHGSSNALASSGEATSSAVNLPWLGASVVVVLVIGAFLLWYYCILPNTSRQEIEISTPLLKFSRDFPNFEVGFPLQENLLWKRLKAAVKSILKDEEPRRPSVVVLLATEDAAATLACLARRLARLIEALFQEPPPDFIHVDSNQYQQQSGEQLKKDLDTMAQSGFRNGSHAFLIENIQQMPADSALMFHGLCDDTNAPFKRVVYLLTMTRPEEKVLDGTKFEVTSIWKQELKVDVRSALESRIGAFVAAVQSESENLLKTQCS